MLIVPLQRDGGLSPGTVIPATNRYLHETSKEEASCLRKETAKLHAVNKYTFQSMPCPIREDWNHIETLHPLILELSYAEETREAKDKWKKAMKQLRDTPGAWALEHKDAEAEATDGAKVMKLCPVTACDDMELNEVNLSIHAGHTW